MKNTVHYIKPEGKDYSEAIKLGMAKALSLVRQKSISNIKFVVPGLNFVSSPPNFVSSGLELLFQNKGVYLTNELSKNKGFPIPVDFPTTGVTTGVNLVTINKLPSFGHDEPTVAILLGASSDIFLKLESALFRTNIDLVVVVQNESDQFNELLSVCKASYVSSILDNSVVPYLNQLSKDELAVISKIDGINTTSPWNHTHTQNQMKLVITELKTKNMLIDYQSFLGYLINHVGFPIGDSVALLNWKRKYFGR